MTDSPKIDLMKVATIKWAKAVFAAFVTGASSSFLSVLGVSGAQAVGINIQQFSPKQLVATTVAGGLIGMAAYLKQSPVPPDDAP